MVMLLPQVMMSMQMLTRYLMLMEQRLPLTYLLSAAVEIKKNALREENRL